MLKTKSMDEEANSYLQKCLSDGAMDADDGPLINENSNDLSHLLNDGAFNSVEAVGVDDSSTSNQAFLHAVELSAGSVGEYLDNNTESFNADSFDVGDNAVNFPSDSMNNVLSDGDSRLSATFKETSNIDLDQNTETEPPSELDINDTASFADISTSADDEMKKTNMDNSIEVSNEYKHDDISDKNNLIKESNEPSDDKDLQDVELDGKDSLATEENIKKSETLEETSMEVIEVPVIEENIDQNKKEEVNIKENVDNIDKDAIQKGGAEETEVVSEDELPAVQKPSVKDAENVSDDELPGPKPAELPADTEVVSEDELPASKKDTKESRKRKNGEERDGYDPGSPTSEGESAGKKQALAKNGESKPIPSEKRSSVDEKPKKKTLPELDKYWKVVNDDPTDFTGWTYLLQYVDQESDVEAAREAYDAFLSHYPYCYGYWRKYADYEKRKGSKKKCLEVSTLALHPFNIFK